MKSSEFKTNRASFWVQLSAAVTLVLIIGAIGISQRTRNDDFVIVITSEVRARLAREFAEIHQKEPSDDEVAARVAHWKRDEALYREALRQGLDEEDSEVRAVLLKKMRRHAEREIASREPTDEELRAYLASHEAEYSASLRYAYQFVVWSRGEEGAVEARRQVEKRLSEGARLDQLGLSVHGGSLTAEDLSKKLDPRLAARILQLEPGVWRAVDGDDELYLARLRSVSGGVPPFVQLRHRLRLDWIAEQRRQAVDAVLGETVKRYRFQILP